MQSLRRPTILRPAALIALLAVLAASCGRDTGSTTSSAEPEKSAEQVMIDKRKKTCAPVGDEKPRTALLRCSEPSLAFVSTPDGSGTGIVTVFGDATYVVTNAHVISPYGSANVRIGNDDKRKAVPVIGIDAGADIALLGPLDDPRPDPLPIAEGTDLDKGADVFLFGYPAENNGENEAELDATIATGVVSKYRKVPAFGQTYVQTDAAIAGGQSGGPLFDSQGRVLGVSGLSFAESKFALALSGGDVRTAAERILAGKGDDWERLPQSDAETAGGATSGTVTATDSTDTQVLFVPPSTTERALTFSVPNQDAVVSISDNDGVLAVSAAAARISGELASQLSAELGIPEDVLASDLNPFAAPSPEVAAAEVAPNSFSVTIRPDTPVRITIDVPRATTRIDVAWTSGLPTWVASGPIDERRIESGAALDEVMTSGDAATYFLIDLIAGSKIKVESRSPQGETSVTMFDPDAKLDPLTLATSYLGLGDEDPTDSVTELAPSDEGLYGADIAAEITTKKSGTYRFRRLSQDGVPVLTTFKVTVCPATGCPDEEPVTDATPTTTTTTTPGSG